jgi:hypothetical protein
MIKGSVKQDIFRGIVEFSFFLLQAFSSQGPLNKVWVDMPTAVRDRARGRGVGVSAWVPMYKYAQIILLSLHTSWIHVSYKRKINEKQRGIWPPSSKKIPRNHER